jgi:hypothetical protein
MTCLMTGDFVSCVHRQHAIILSFIHSFSHTHTHTCTQIKCPSVQQHIHLCHLQALFLALESKRDSSQGGGDPLDKVALKYREALPEHVLSVLRAAIAVGDIDRGVFIPLLREFATEQLCTGEDLLLLCRQLTDCSCKAPSYTL